MDHSLQIQISKLNKEERAELDKLFDNYERTSKQKKPNKNHHEASQKLAEAIHNIRYGKYSIPPPSPKMWKRWKNKLTKFLKEIKEKGVFKMLNEKKVNGLSEELKQELDKLTDEYNAAAKANGISGRNADKETNARYNQATVRLAEFVMRHNLNSRH
jgi:hypothetical protein